MLSLNTPPLSPILAGRIAMRYEPHDIPAPNTPPPSPILKGVRRESCILVTREVRVEHEDKVKYEVEVKHEAGQVRRYLAFSRTSDLLLAEI